MNASKYRLKKIIKTKRNNIKTTKNKKSNKEGGQRSSHEYQITPEEQERQNALNRLEHLRHDSTNLNNTKKKLIKAKRDAHNRQLITEKSLKLEDDNMQRKYNNHTKEEIQVLDYLKSLVKEYNKLLLKFKKKKLEYQGPGFRFPDYDKSSQVYLDDMKDDTIYLKGELTQMRKEYRNLLLQQRRNNLMGGKKNKKKTKRLIRGGGIKRSRTVPDFTKFEEKEKFDELAKDFKKIKVFPTNLKKITSNKAIEKNTPSIHGGVTPDDSNKSPNGALETQPQDDQTKALEKQEKQKSKKTAQNQLPPEEEALLDAFVDPIKPGDVKQKEQEKVVLQDIPAGDENMDKSDSKQEKVEQPDLPAGDENMDNSDDSKQKKVVLQDIPAGDENMDNSDDSKQEKVVLQDIPAGDENMDNSDSKQEKVVLQDIPAGDENMDNSDSKQEKVKQPDLPAGDENIDNSDDSKQEKVEQPEDIPVGDENKDNDKSAPRRNSRATSTIIKRMYKAVINAAAAGQPEEVLDVKPGATKAEITKAYANIALVLHPDKVNGAITKEEADEAMKVINNAKEILTGNAPRPKALKRCNINNDEVEWKCTLTPVKKK